MIQTVFYPLDAGFPMLAILAFCALTALFTMALVAWHDCRTFEIDFGLLGVAAFSMAGVIAITAGPDALPPALMAAGVAGTITWLARCWKPGRLGQGDIRLMGFVGFASGPQWAVPVLAVFCLFCALTAASSSRARGKRLFASMFPAALPGMGAAALALILRLTGIGGWNAVLVEFDGMETIPQVIIGSALVVALIGGGIILIAGRIRAWNR